MIQNIVNLREERVSQRCDRALEKVNNIKKEDLLFNIYCKMVEERKELKNIDNKPSLHSIEEQWSIFLYSLNVANKELDKVKSECDNFKKTIFSE